MQLISLFSGIGGFELAGEWAGWENISSCEINPFCRTILKYYWPNTYHHDDIKTLDCEEIKKRLDPNKPTIICGGFPCQPYSVAGKRKGKNDERHLWPEMFRAIKSIQPDWVVGENVHGIINWNGGVVFNEVQADLEIAGYEVFPYVLPACAVNAPHRRDRVWFVAFKSTGGVHRGKYKEVSIQGTNTNTASNGHKIGYKKAFGEIRSSEQRGMQQFERMGGEWDVANSSNPRTESMRPERKNKVHKFSNASDTDGNDERLLCRQQPEQPFKAHTITSDNGGSRTASNTESWRIGMLRNEGGKTGTSESSNPLASFCGVSRKIITNSTSNGGVENNGERKSKFINQNSTPTDWKNFPTQPPICGGDDGIPTELDGITFSKWRNESIKAYGNAIVPQVVYEIFKTINKYNSLNT